MKRWSRNRKIRRDSLLVIKYFLVLISTKILNLLISLIFNSRKTSSTQSYILMVRVTHPYPYQRFHRWKSPWKCARFTRPYPMESRTFNTLIISINSCHSRVWVFSLRDNYIWDHSLVLKVMDTGSHIPLWTTADQLTIIFRLSSFQMGSHGI